MATVAQRRHIVAVRVLKHIIRISSLQYPPLSQGERRVAERLRADLGSDPHVDGVDTDPCIDSDVNFGVDLSGLEHLFSGTINGKRDVGVQMGCEHFFQTFPVESMMPGLVVRQRWLW